jgi:NADH-quinone oxidoreductase subunit G
VADRRDPVSFEIDGRTLVAPAGTMLVDAAAMHGIEIPIFCYEPRLGPPIGACRMCLVEVEGMRGLQTACSTPVAPDMVVRTRTPEVVDAQEGVLELLLINHPLDCPVCDKGGECPLQDRTFRFGPGASRFTEPKRHFPKPLDLSPLIALDRERCITCYRCVRFSQDVAQDRELIFAERGDGSFIATRSGGEYRGRFTGNVVDLCPVGALTSIPYRFVARPWDVVNTPSVCAHCPVGCNSELTGRDGRIRRVTGRPEPNAAVEEGWLCDKGRWAYPSTFGPDRVTRPVVRELGSEREATLEEALDRAALLLSRAAAPAFLLGPEATVEEGFIAQDLVARALPGGRVARLGIPGEALGALRALPAAELGDLDRADLVAVIGGDPSNGQPVVELRVRKAQRNGARIVVVGPRPTPLDGLGGLVRTEPGRLLTGFDLLEDALANARSAVVLWDEADLAGEPAAAERLAGMLAGRPGARQLELGADVNGAGLRALGIPAGGLIEAATAQRVGTLVAVHADPETGPGGGAWSAALERVGPIVAIASHHGPITERASVVLPALTAYEQEGVLVSMTGRAQRLRPGAPGPERAAAGWELLIALSHRIGTPLPYRTARQAFAAAAAASPALAGLSYETLGVLGQPVARPAAPPAGAPAREPEGEGLLLVPCPAIFGDAASYRSDALAAVRTLPAAGLSPTEAARLGLADGEPATLASPYGRVTLPIRVDARLADGAAFVDLGAPAAPGAEALLPPDRGPVRVEVTRV